MKKIKYILMSAAVIAVSALMPLTAFAEESSAPVEVSVSEQSASSAESHDESVVESSVEESDVSTDTSVVSVPQEESSQQESSEPESSIEESSMEESSMEESSELPEESSQEEISDESGEVVPTEESSKDEEESSEPEEDSEESIIEEIPEEDISEILYELRRDPLSWMSGIETILPSDRSDYTPPSVETTEENENSEEDSKLVMEDSETSRRTITATPTINNETPEIAVFLAERNDRSPMLIGIIIFSIAGMLLTIITILIMHSRGDFTPSFFQLPPPKRKRRRR